MVAVNALITMENTLVIREIGIVRTWEFISYARERKLRQRMTRIFPHTLAQTRGVFVIEIGDTC